MQGEINNKENRKKSKKYKKSYYWIKLKPKADSLKQLIKLKILPGLIKEKENTNYQEKVTDDVTTTPIEIKTKHTKMNIIYVTLRNLTIQVK